MDFNKWKLLMLAIGIWAFHLLFILIHYNDLPELVPTHMKASGEVDGYGPKWTVFLDLAVNIVLLIFISLVINKPQWANYPTEITKENKELMYQKMQNFLGCACIILSIFFFVISLNSFGLTIFNVPMFIILFVSLFSGLIYIVKSK